MATCFLYAVAARVRGLLRIYPYFASHPDIAEGEFPRAWSCQHVITIPFNHNRFVALHLFTGGGKYISPNMCGIAEHNSLGGRLESAYGSFANPSRRCEVKYTCTHADRRTHMHAHTLACTLQAFAFLAEHQSMTYGF